MKYIALFSVVLLLSSDIVVAANAMSLEHANRLQEQVTISPVQFEGHDLASSSVDPVSMPSMLCASLGYPRLVSFEMNSEKSIRQYLKEGIKKLFVIQPAGDDSEGYSKAHGAYYYSSVDLKDAFFKSQKLTTLSSVTCAKSL